LNKKTIRNSQLVKAGAGFIITKIAEKCEIQPDRLSLRGASKDSIGDEAIFLMRRLLRRRLKNGFRYDSSQ